MNDQSAHSKVIYEKNKQIGDLFNQKNELKRQVDELEGMNELANS